MPYRTIDLTKIRTYHLGERRNLVTLADLVSPEAPPPPFDNAELGEVAARIVAARRAGRPVIWMIGAHVVKVGLSRVLIDLMRRGVITHLAANGAGSIHDFELALIGETSEDVATSIEDGTFGMVEETGALMNAAIRAGARDGLGYGEAIGRAIAEDPRFVHHDASLFYTAYRLGVPATVHASIGADIIHQHPQVDFGALGWASGQDFKIYCASVAELEGGVFCNFGSSVTGPEVFLKALSIVRNLGHRVEKITTANFDLIDLGDYHRPVGMDHRDYYYRPRKNIVNRPVSLGGRGFHVTGDHTATIPNLYHHIRKALGDDELPVEDRRSAGVPIGPAEQAVLDGLVARRPELAEVKPALTGAFRAIAACFERGGSLFLAGNGGSMADALHMSAELLKGYAGHRPFPDRLSERFAGMPGGETLLRNLEPGLRAHVLGTNLSLHTAVANDYPARNMAFAQELFVLARPGDVFFGISTSGNAENVGYAVAVARGLGLTVVALTGQPGGRLAADADVAVRVPAGATARVQELHLPVYHALCEMLEAHFGFPTS